MTVTTTPPTPPAAKSKRHETLKDPRFWSAAAERSVLTFFQAFAAELAVFKAADVAEIGLTGLPWSIMLSVSAFASLTSFVTSVSKAAGGSEGPGMYERLKEKKNKELPQSEGGTVPSQTDEKAKEKKGEEEPPQQEGETSSAPTSSDHFPEEKENAVTA